MNSTQVLICNAANQIAKSTEHLLDMHHNWFKAVLSTLSFHGTSKLIRPGRRRHGKHRRKSNEREYGPKPQKHKHTNGFLKPKPTPVISYDESHSFKRGRSKRRLYKEISQLIEQNYLLKTQAEVTGDLTNAKGKDEKLSRLERKYEKLEQSHCKLQAAYEKVDFLLCQQNREIKRVHLQNKESIMVMDDTEQEQDSLATLVHKLKNDNYQLNEDINLLKNLVYQLNIEIEKYQDKTRTLGNTVQNQTIVNTSDETTIHCKNKNIAEAWGNINFHALGPLLDSYQENLKEKDDLIQNYQNKLDEFTGKFKVVIAENEELHNDIEKMRTKYNKHEEEMKCFERDACVIKHQNDVISNQVSLQKQKFQEICAVYEQKIESISQEYNELQKNHLGCKTELNRLKGRFEILSQGYNELKNNTEKTMPISVHNSAIEECKKLFEELKQQYQTETKKLHSRLKNFEELLPENEKLIKTLSLERDQLKIEAKNMEKNVKQTQYKLEQIQNFFDSTQVSRIAFKQLLVKTRLECERLAKEQEKLVLERNKLLKLLEEKEKENEDIQFIGSNISRRMGTLKNQFKIVQGAKKQLCSVEKHIRNQEMGVDQMNTEFQRELYRLKSLLLQKEDVIRKMQMEKNTTQSNLEFVWRSASTNSKAVSDISKIPRD